MSELFGQFFTAANGAIWFTGHDGDGFSKFQDRLAAELLQVEERLRLVDMVHSTETRQALKERDAERARADKAEERAAGLEDALAERDIERARAEVAQRECGLLRFQLTEADAVSAAACKQRDELRGLLAEATHHRVIGGSMADRLDFANRPDIQRAIHPKTTKETT